MHMCFHVTEKFAYSFTEKGENGQENAWLLTVYNPWHKTKHFFHWFRSFCYLWSWKPFSWWASLSWCSLRTPRTLVGKNGEENRGENGRWQDGRGGNRREWLISVPADMVTIWSHSVLVRIFLVWSLLSAGNLWVAGPSLFSIFLLLECHKSFFWCSS